MNLGTATATTSTPGCDDRSSSGSSAFKYWYTEPTPPGLIDNKYYWSENHRIIFHTLEYLAGQAFPKARFDNDGRTGAEHRAHAKQLIDDWIAEKARFGFTEWHSDVYYQKDVTPLLSLVEWADDERSPSGRRCCSTSSSSTSPCTSSTGTAAATGAART